MTKQRVAVLAQLAPASHAAPGWELSHGNLTVHLIL